MDGPGWIVILGGRRQTKKTDNIQEIFEGKERLIRKNI